MLIKTRCQDPASVLVKNRVQSVVTTLMKQVIIRSKVINICSWSEVSSSVFSKVYLLRWKALESIVFQP